jgi:cell division protein FtsN
MSKPSLQPGTTLGIVVGSVFGLVLALLVALYLANSGAPVQTKAQNASARIDLPKNASSAPDPNEFLYGKPQPKPELELSEAEQVLLDEKMAADTKRAKLKAAKNDAKPKQPDTLNEAAIDSLDGAAIKGGKPTVAVDTAAKKSLYGVSKEAVAKSEVLPKVVTIDTDQDAIGKIAAIVTPKVSAHKTADKTFNDNTHIAHETVKPNTVYTDTNVSAAKSERYFVQVGAYANESEAQAVKSKAASQGVAVGVSPRDKNGLVLYRVRTAPLPPLDAERLRNTLKANGMEAALVKVQ